MSILRSVAIYLLVLTGVRAYAQGVPDDCTQLILGIAPTWDSMRGELRLFERSHRGDWVSVAGPFPVLFGKNGLAWGAARHNCGSPEPGSGSATILHTRRGVNRQTTGCATMSKENLVKLITWSRANRHPCYALLPAAEYDKKWRSWNLPSPETVHPF